MVKQSALSGFNAATRAWFEDSFDAPTPVQSQGWAKIRDGAHTLMLAPTGSGKTLAAFLWCVDRLLHSPADAAPGIRTVYISPLKALAYDVERNLTAPLVGIGQRAARAGTPLRDLRVDVRTGDTPQTMRRQQAKRPGDILITTPESLFLILGSKARENLRSVDTVIIDEIHVMAAGKRGVHLALSLERLAELADAEPQRIGLSATQRPLEEIARYLGGHREVAIVDTSEPPHLDLRVLVPVPDMTEPAQGDLPRSGSGPILTMTPQDPEARTSIWPAIHPRLFELVQQHRSTIIFANSRRLTERLAQKINEMAGEDLVRAHHGSISREQREQSEQALKEGRLRGMVATSSLELGIDMGAVDLVVQIESPGAVSRGLQRVGRAGHSVGERSIGRVIPKHRGDLLEAAVVCRRMLDGEIESTRVPRNTLDVLAQHIVAMCAVAPRQVDEVAALARRTHSFAELTRDALESVLDMVSGRYPSDDFADLRPSVTWNRETDLLTPRRSARLLAIQNAGTIPDRGLYAVHLGLDGPRVGELDEEMVHEARAGETFLLGATTWRIEEITRDRVIVSPAPGEPGKMPFWRGDGPGRPIELGRAIGAFLRELGSKPAQSAQRWLQEDYQLDDFAADNLVAYISEQREVTGALPSDEAITVECFRDELGDWRVCILSVFGARVHAPWALALQSMLGEDAGFDVQTLWSDDGIVLRFADSETVPEADALIPDPDEVQELVVEQLARSAMFASHFRENAARALLLPRRRPGSRTPLWMQRLRSQTLLAVASRYPAFPIVLETYRECLQEVFDMPSLQGLLRDIRSRRVRVDVAETASASPFSRQLAFEYVATYLYEGDAPIAERKAQALALDRNLLRELLGQEEMRDLLDAEVIEEVEAELQCIAEHRRARHADALHDMLRRLGDLSEAEIRERCVEDPSDWLKALERDRQAMCLRVGGEARWLAVEDAGRYRDALGVALPPGLPSVFLAKVPDALDSLLLRWARHHAPFQSAAITQRYGLTLREVDAVMRALEARGLMLRGAFRPGGQGDEWCEPEVLRRLRRRTLARLRNEVAPVDAEVLGRFLPRWQRVGSKRLGESGLRDALVQLEGVGLPFSELEERILPARVPDYQPQMLDALGATGELVWVGCGSLGPRDGRIALYRRERVGRLLAADAPELPEGLPPQEAALCERVLTHLRDRGASFLFELQARCGEGESLSQEQLSAALWTLVWAGLVTNDTFQPLRGLRMPKHRRGRRGGARSVPATGGRWAAVSDLRDDSLRPEDRARARAHMLLDRYGVVSREATAAESLPGGFSEVGRLLRFLEEAGKVRRGYFVDGLAGAQFAHLGAVDRLRAERGDDDETRVVVLAATDPANPFGALLPWPQSRNPEQRPSRRAGASLILVRGRPAIYVESSGKRIITFRSSSEEELSVAATEGLAALCSQLRRRSLSIERVDGEPAAQAEAANELTAAGLARDYRGLAFELPP